MGKFNCDIRIGTSGWHYGHWKGSFYPENIPKGEWFGHYAKYFDTVEVNNTFYQLPKEQTFKNWHRQAPKSFLYTIKANRYITHIKRLKDPADSLERFFERARLLKENLGPVLYQLPPGFHKDLDRLRTFLRALPRENVAIFEFRHDSWFSEDTYGLLRQFNAAFCIHDMPSVPAPKVITSDTIYLRFHGPTGRYQGSYSNAALKSCAGWLKEHTKDVRSVYIYFNNDANAYAVNNAIELKKILIP